MFATWMRLAFALLITLLIIYRAYKKQSLSTSGCVAAFFVGCIVSFSSFCHFASMLVFFASSNVATRFRQDVKRFIDTEFKKNGQRDAWQVISNGFAATLFSAMFIYECGYGENPIRLSQTSLRSSFCSLAVLSAFCCCAGDTLASEIGTAYGKKANNDRVWHLTRFCWVPRGTNGGVTVVGTCASILGGFLVSLAFYATLVASLSMNSSTYVEPGRSIWHLIASQSRVVLIGTFSGLFGSFIDSILGGCFQFSGYNRKSKKITQHKDKDTDHISGLNLLTNNQVNCVSSLITSIAVPYISLYWNIF